MKDMLLPLRSILQIARLKQFPKGQIVLYKDDSPGEVYVVKSGVVKIYDIDDQGNEKILHIVKSPALLPFVFFSGDSAPVKWFYVALTDCEMYVLPKATLNEVMRADGGLSVALVNRFSVDVHELLVRLSSLGKTNVRDKLFAALKFLVVRHAGERKGGWWRVAFPVNHQLLADLSGITRESAAMTMKELQTEKLVRSPRLGLLEINRERLTGNNGD